MEFRSVVDCRWSLRWGGYSIIRSIKVSQKGLYALKALMILAARRDRGTIRVHDIAQEGGLPVKFLQSILLELKNARMIASVRGAKGGYELRRDAKDLRLGEIIRLVDGPCSPFDAQDFFAKGLSSDRRHQALCELFIDLHDASVRIFDNTTLADLISEPACGQAARESKYTT
ncbi:MAG: Rrf2 family transcriptional regulator [Candidatus Sulfotelmatobacter sp.]